MPLKLYQNLRAENPEEQKRIIRSDAVLREGSELDLMVELIRQLTAGITELEGELASMLMRDLEHMSSIMDMTFVNKVFLPLLRIEKTLPICLWPFDSDSKKWLSSYKPDTQQTNNNDSGQGGSLSHSNFVPS
jgi:hypothetical protein